MNYKPQLICLTVASWILFPMLSQAENWPQWRGPGHNGISTEKGIPTQWSTEKNVAWKISMPGQGGATPVVWGDRLFVTSADGDDLVLICVDVTKGNVLWQRKVSSGNQDARAGEGNSASPSPSTDGEHVWVFFSTGVLACYDFEGHENWKCNVADRFGKIDIQFGMTSTPVLHGDALYLQLIHGAMVRDDNTRTGKVIKLNKLTGETIWEVDRVTDAQFECKHSYASPFLYDHDGVQFLVVHGANCTTAHSLQTGAELWRFSNLNGPTDINPGRYDPTFRFVASPGTANGKIIIPTAKEGPTVTLNVTSDSSGELSQQPSSIAWKLDRTPDVSIPLAVDNLVYLLHKDGRLQCVDLASGQEKYFERTHSGQHRCSPLYVDGHIIYCGSKDGVCTVVKAGPEMQVVATNNMEAPITASPIVANGTLYLRSYDYLYAIRAN
ncbi:MAG: PQQ-binding-like beta-propeller repeat protein [Planctomycetales bacterium]|nr:PQQ-binding-like beta-propeller repeat protein [Planctomycetales bacterium]